MILELPYQRAGTEFLKARTHAYLGDEMRLGKSKQAINAADEAGLMNILVIGPAIGRRNWLREFEKHSTIKRNLQTIEKKSDRVATMPPRVASISYELVRDPDMLEHLKLSSWDLLIVDEAQYVKSRTAVQTKAILGREGLVHFAKRTWLLSGTPDPNGDPGELWTALKVLYPAGCDNLSYDEFMDRYTVRWQVGRAHFNRYVIKRVKNIDELKAKIEPFFLRRTKKQVRSELPSMRFGEISLDVPNAPRGDMIDEQSSLRRELGLAKCKPLADAIAEEYKSGGFKKMVIFGWHIDVVEDLANLLRHRTMRTVVIHGHTSPGHRENALRAFASEDEVACFVGQIKACGTNISLAAADDVVFAELSWSPGDNLQAMMRVEDPSKRVPCTTRFAIAADSLDEVLMATLRRKENWTRELLGD